MVGVLDVGLQDVEAVEARAGARQESAAAGPSVPINSKFTFENFVYGDENKHAYQSSVRFALMADEPGIYTSLFIYGNPDSARRTSCSPLRTTFPNTIPVSA